jgi:hypothetical protein
LPEGDAPGLKTAARVPLPAGGTPVLAVYAVLSAALLALPLWLPVGGLLGRLVPDDGFYYLKIARNVALTGFQSFDGINWTNGFHPLWGWLLMGLMRPLRGLGLEEAFRATVAVNAALMAAAGWFCCRAWHLDFPREWHIGLPLFAALLFFSYSYLMETALVLAMAGLCLDWTLGVLRGGTRRAMDWAAFGVLLALLGLARLDMVFLGAGLFLAAGLDASRRHGARWGILLAAIAAVTAAIPLAAWMAVTRLQSGHWSTISGRLKLHLANPWFHREYLLGLWGPVGLACIALSAAFLAGWAAWRVRARRPSPPWSAVMLALCASTLLHAAFQVFFVRGAFAWSVSHYRLVPVALAVVAAHHATARLRRVTPVVCAGAALLALAPFVAWNGWKLARESREPGSWTWMAYEAAAWAREKLPADSVFATKDAGVFGYFTGMPVVNLDGLVNSYEFQDAVRDEKHLDFLRRCKVTHLVQHNVETRELGRPYRFWFKSNLHEHEAQPLMIPPDKVAWMSRRFRHGAEESVCVIWKFDP